MEKEKAPWKTRWKEIKEIDRGGQGIVAKLEEIPPGNREAVIKRIVPRWKDNAQAKERLFNEAETLRKLKDLGAKVPEVYESSNPNDNLEPYFIMEFISGVRFDKWLAEYSPVNLEDSVIVTRSILETIALCHKHEIGHRDLKPANIILKDGSIDKPFILDFGISFDSQHSMILTRKGEMFWNEFIILPEGQDLSGGHRDLRSDITALAGVFFFCITGKSPGVLRDSSGAPPQKRYEQEIRSAGKSSIRSESLIWFFNTAFNYEIAGRFQKLDAFTSELAKFSAPTTIGSLSFAEQFGMLDQKIMSSDREAQLRVLHQRYLTALEEIKRSLKRSLKSEGGPNLRFETQDFNFKSTELSSWQAFVGQEVFPANVVRQIGIAQVHSKTFSVVRIIGIPIEMQIQFYASSENVPRTALNQLGVSDPWQKVAIWDASSDQIPKELIRSITETCMSLLAHSVRNLLQ